MQLFSKLLKFTAYALLLWSIIALGSCAPARTLLKQANLTPTPSAPAKLENLDASYRALERAIYGDFTPPSVFTFKSSETLETDWLNGKATVERRVYSVSHGQTPQDLEIIFVTPNAEPLAPLILSQNFSRNKDVISANGVSPLSTETASTGLLGPVFTYFFGRYIVTPPLEAIIDRGYGFVAMHPPDYIADNAKIGTAQLNTIFGETENRPAALITWASLSTALANELKQEAPTRPIIAFGHSRYGKTALLAAARGNSIDAAIAHQSGTAGASLLRDTTGETVKDVVGRYPHWLTPSASQYAETPRALPTDAHALLAFISPKPILLGNARRDVWSDPEGAFRAAKWAAHNTGQTFSAARLNDFKANDDIAFWTRPGTHGVVKEDWPAFLDFLDAHFK